MSIAGLLITSKNAGNARPPCNAKPPISGFVSSRPLKNPNNAAYERSFRKAAEVAEKTQRKTFCCFLRAVSVFSASLW
jgi:hypothetical protein